MVALRSLCRSVRSVAVNRHLLCHPPHQHYSYSTGVASRRTLSNISPPMAKHLFSDDYGSRGLGSRRFLHRESLNSATIQYLYDQIEEEAPDRLEKYAFEMHDFLMKEGLEEEANRLFKPFLQKKRAKVPAVAVLTLMMHTFLSSGETDKALKVLSHMLATGVSPSTYTYTILVASLAIAATSDSDSDSDPNLIRYAKKYFLEMLDKGMKPNKVYAKVFEGIACLETKEEVRGFLELIKAKGFVSELIVEEGHIEDAIKGMKLLHDLEKTPDKEMQRVFRDWRIHGFEKQTRNILNRMVEDGHEEEAWLLFGKQAVETCLQNMVVAYTCVIEAYINAGKTNGALDMYQRMLADGYAPCSYTYAVLIKALAADPSFFGVAKMFFLEMMEKGMRPNAATYTAVLEGFAMQEDKAAAEEGKECVKVMMQKGFLPNAEAVREVLKGKPTPFVTRVMDIISSK